MVAESICSKNERRNSAYFSVFYLKIKKNEERKEKQPQMCAVNVSSFHFILFCSIPFHSVLYIIFVSPIWSNNCYWLVVWLLKVGRYINIGTLLNCCLTILIWYAKKQVAALCVCVRMKESAIRIIIRLLTYMYKMCYVHRWQISKKNERGTNHHNVSNFSALVSIWRISICRRSSSMCWAFCKFHFLFFRCCCCSELFNTQFVINSVFLYSEYGCSNTLRCAAQPQT